jgi:hypothetical protein
MKHLMNFSQFLTEGIKLVNGRPVLDFEQDSPDDIVKLANAPAAGSSNYRVADAKVAMYSGYAMERADGATKVQLMDALKKPDAVTDEELTRLIELTYPANLVGRKVDVIIPAGSSSPLALRIANTIKELYYPNAKVIDVMKRFYADPLAIVNWEAYAKADTITREQLDSYLKNHVAGYWNGPAAMAWSKRTGQPIQEWPGMENSKTSQSTDFTGFIKKSSGLRSGSRRLLNPGHHVDDYIINAFKSSAEAYQELMRNPNYNKISSVITAGTPYFMVVDDMLVGGTTLKGIIDNIAAKLTDENLKDYAKYISTYSLLKYSGRAEDSPEQKEERSKAAAEKLKAKKAKQKEIDARSLQIFRDASRGAKQSNVDLDKLLKSLIDSENRKESAKPAEDRVEFTVDMVKAAAKNANIL